MGLTKHGRMLVPKLAPRVRASNARFLRTLNNEEQTALIETIKKMLTNASEVVESDEDHFDE